MSTLPLLLDDWFAKGGAGSGNFGHAGRPGEIGGSGPGGSQADGDFGSLPPGAVSLIRERMDQHNIKMDRLVKVIRARIDEDSLREGAQWYPEASRIAGNLANKYSVSKEQAAAVIAAMSPLASWSQNQQTAEAILAFHATGKDGTDPKVAALRFRNTPTGKHVIGLPDNIVKSFAILHGASVDQTLSGDKVTSFYKNILKSGHTDDVTIDTHMMKIFSEGAGLSLAESRKLMMQGSIKPGRQVSSVGYAVIASAIRKAAQELHAPPSTVQAAYWLKVRGDKGFKWAA